jgi:hypothetical protein
MVEVSDVAAILCTRGSGGMAMRQCEPALG